MAYPIGLGIDRRIDELLSTPAPYAAQRRAQAPLARLATPAPPSGTTLPAQRTSQLAAAAAGSRAMRAQADRALSRRDGQLLRERETTDSAVSGNDGAPPVAPCRERGDGQHGQEGEDGDGDQAAEVASTLACAPDTQDDLDGALIAQLAAQSTDSGMFEVLLPGGATLGVSVHVRSHAIDYLLTTASEPVAAQLRRRQMELAGQLGQRIGRSVSVTVL
jgi:hypothetical protein